MANAEDSSISLLQRVTLQAEVLVPLLQHLRAELGEAQANALVYPVLRDCVRRWTVALASSESDSAIETWQRASDAVTAQAAADVDWEVLRDDESGLDFDVTACRFADFFRRLGEPELGAILTCEIDDHIAEQAATAVSFSRPETIMQGGARCPFRYRFADRDDGKG